MPAPVTRLAALLVVVVIAMEAFALPADVSATTGDRPLVSFTAPESITEGEPAVFTFRRTGDLSDELYVNLDFYFEGDFLQTDEMPEVWFAAGEAETVLSIPTVDDGTPEPDGSIGVHLQRRFFDPEPYDPQAPVYQQVTVLDND